METMPHHWHEKCPNMGHPPSPFSLCFSVTKVTTVQPVCVWVCVLVVFPFTTKYIQFQLQKYAFVQSCLCASPQGVLSPTKTQDMIEVNLIFLLKCSIVQFLPPTDTHKHTRHLQRPKQLYFF